MELYLYNVFRMLASTLNFFFCFFHILNHIPQLWPMLPGFSQDNFIYCFMIISHNYWYRKHGLSSAQYQFASIFRFL